MDRKYIYLNEEEELGEIIDKIKEASEKEIVLVVPSDTKSLLYPTNLDILKREVDRLKKKVYISSLDEKLNNLAKSRGFDLFLEDLEENKVKIVDVKPVIKKTKEEKVQKAKALKPSFEILFLFFKKLIKYLIYTFIITVPLSFLYLTFQTKAEIIIETEKNNISINEILTINEKVIEPDYDKKIIPGKYVKIIVTTTESIETTGKETKTESQLKVLLLNYSDYERVLIGGTRVAYQNNIFKITQKVIIPPKNNDEPGTSTVFAIPDKVETGLFLMKNADLIIPAFDEKPELSYLKEEIKAKVAEDYTYNKEVSVKTVTPEDITNIRIKLENSLKEKLKSKIYQSYQNFEAIFDPSFVKIEKEEINSKVGDKKDYISAYGEASLETMIVQKGIIQKFIKNYLNKENNKNNENIFVEKIDLKSPNIIDFNFKNKEMIIGIEGSAVLGPNLNSEFIKKEIQGKSLNEVRNYFEKIKGIKGVRIKIFPSWKDYLPKDINRIKIEIN